MRERRERIVAFFLPWVPLDCCGFSLSGFRWFGFHWSGFRWSGFRWKLLCSLCLDLSVCLTHGDPLLGGTSEIAHVVQVDPDSRLTGDNRPRPVRPPAIVPR